MRNLLVIIATFLLGASLLACSSDSCEQNQSSVPLAGFYSVSTKKSQAIDSLTIYGVGVPNDSLLLNNKRANNVHLPLRAKAEETSFVIHYNKIEYAAEENNDTLTIKYEAAPFFDSNECGAFYVFNIKDYSHTRHLVDSVSFITKRINNIDAEAIRIFFKDEQEVPQ